MRVSEDKRVATVEVDGAYRADEVEIDARIPRLPALGLLS